MTYYADKLKLSSTRISSRVINNIKGSTGRKCEIT